MALNDLLGTKGPCDPVQADDYNRLRLAMLGPWVGRNNPTGVVQALQDLGTELVPWNIAWIKKLNVDGVFIDFASLESFRNRITSGEVYADCNQPGFLSIDGTTASVTVDAASTDLELVINDSATTVSTDLTEAGLTVAPAANNTCLINNVTLAGQAFTKYLEALTIDTAGTEITTRVGQYQAFRVNATGEIFIGFINSATSITNIRRGYFFDSADAPIVRGVLSDNNILTVLSTGWIFVEDDALTVNVSYRTPVYAGRAPTAPVTGDYWLDLTTQEWKRYSGASFDVVNRILIGIVVLNTTAAIGVRASDFTRTFEDLNTISLEFQDTNTIRAKSSFDWISVYGREIQIDDTKTKWVMPTDLEPPLVEQPSTTYYLYISDEGETFISDEAPLNRQDLRGFYHPYCPWRCVGSVVNDAGSNFGNPTDIFNGIQTFGNVQTFTASGTFIVPSGVNKVLVVVQGGGSGNGAAIGGGGGGGTSIGFVSVFPGQSIAVTVGAGSVGAPAGGTSSFGAFITATGGAGGVAATSAGGVGVGGFLNITGKAGYGAAAIGSVGGDSHYGQGGFILGGVFTFAAGFGGGSGGGGGALGTGTSGVVVVRW